VFAWKAAVALNVFELRDRLVAEYGEYVRSFISIRDEHIRSRVEAALDEGLLWPEPRVALNPSFEAGKSSDELVAEGILHSKAAKVFRIKAEGQPDRPLRLHRHQEEAIRTARTGASFVLTAGTGSGKSLAYMVPIVDHALRTGATRRVQAIVVYPMNALANSQAQELEKFLKRGLSRRPGPVRYARYAGQESDEERRDHRRSARGASHQLRDARAPAHPRGRAEHSHGRRGAALLGPDELHTYRGRQGADVALPVRRVREACRATQLQCIGTPATLAGPGSLTKQGAEVASDGQGPSLRSVYQTAEDWARRSGWTP